MFGSPVFRIVAALLSCAILISLYATPSAARDGRHQPVGLVQLLSSPGQYAGKRISVRGYLGRGGSPGTLFYSPALAGDTSNGITVLDAAADNAMHRDPHLAACLHNGDVEVSGVLEEIRPGAFALLSLQRINSLGNGAPSCVWSRAS